MPEAKSPKNPKNVKKTTLQIDCQQIYWQVSLWAITHNNAKVVSEKPQKTDFIVSVQTIDRFG
jgi:hypothetical protein